MNPQGGNKMAEILVKSLLLNMGAPMMISVLGQALYNVVDTFFVSHIPDTALIVDMGGKTDHQRADAGLSHADHGAGRRNRRRHQRHDRQKLRARGSGTGQPHGGQCNACNAVLLCADFPFRTELGQGLYPFTDNGCCHCGNRDYLSPYYHGFLSASWAILYLEKIVIGTGKTTITMICQLAEAITNIILDPIMIYRLWGCIAMGVAGAA